MKKEMKKMLKGANGVAKKQIDSLRKIVGQKIWVLILNGCHGPDLLEGELVEVGRFNLGLTLECHGLKVHYNFVGISQVVGMVVGINGDILYKRPFDVFPNSSEEHSLVARATLGEKSANFLMKRLNVY